MQQSRPYVDRSNQAYRAGFQLGCSLLDSATHMFPKNSWAFLNGLKKALSESIEETHIQHHISEPPPPPLPSPEQPVSSSLRDVNLALKKREESGHP